MEKDEKGNVGPFHINNYENLDGMLAKFKQVIGTVQSYQDQFEPITN